MTARTVLVTGGTGGIGTAICKRLADAGHRVATNYRNEAKALAWQSAMKAQGYDFTIAKGDVTSPEEAADMVRQIEQALGPVDILVNNAGVNVVKRRLSELAPEDWDYLMHVNATGAYNLINAVLPAMRERRDGVIINVSSIAGVRASILGGAAYSASKHALSALTSVLGQEEKDNGIRATNLCPGEVNTPILDARPVKVSDEHKAQILQPEDVAAAVVFIATLPPRAHVPELIIKPTTQLFA